jgi:hypothetical protein
MKHLPILSAILFVALNVHAGQDVACVQDCYSRGGQGFDRNYCISMCESRPNRGGMMEQPGLPRNPAFDQVEQGGQRRQPLPAVADSKCMKDCQKRDYDYMLCRKQCSYSPYGY